MPLPKKIKPFLPLVEPKTLLPRREELLEKINKDGTFLPKSILHADLDRGFLDFVKNELKLNVEGRVVPTVDIIITTQNWSQFVETWDFQNIDKNIEPPFISTVRIPEVKFGTNPSTLYNIPNRRQFFYAQVPTWDGNRHGYDIYKIPQPVPVDITYQVKIVCNRMRELNQFNKIIIETFASRQAYTQIKGHYIPIVMNNVTDESVMDNDKRRYYVQSYEFTLLGFLIDENEFIVTPAVSRVLQLIEFETNNRKRVKRNSNPDNVITSALFVVGNDVLGQLYDYTANISVIDVINISTYDVYINNDYYGTNINEIQISTNDLMRIEVVKINPAKEGILKFENRLL